MLQYTSRDLLAGVTAVAVSMTLRNYLALPGMVATTLMVFAVLVALFRSESVIPRQVLAIAYLFILLEFVVRAVTNFHIMSPSFVPYRYWNTTAPITKAASQSALVLAPLFLGACAIVVSRNWRHDEPRSRLLIWAGSLATINVALMYFCLHAVLWFGMSRNR